MPLIPRDPLLEPLHGTRRLEGATSSPDDAVQRATHRLMMRLTEIMGVPMGTARSNPALLLDKQSDLTPYQAREIKQAIGEFLVDLPAVAFSPSLARWIDETFDSPVVTRILNQPLSQAGDTLRGPVTDAIDKFAEEHPYWTAAIAVGLAGIVLPQVYEHGTEVVDRLGLKPSFRFPILDDHLLDGHVELEMGPKLSRPRVETGLRSRFGHFTVETDVRWQGARFSEMDPVAHGSRLSYKDGQVEAWMTHRLERFDREGNVRERADRELFAAGLGTRTDSSRLSAGFVLRPRTDEWRAMVELSSMTEHSSLFASMESDGRTTEAFLGWSLRF